MAYIQVAVKTVPGKSGGDGTQRDGRVAYLQVEVKTVPCNSRGDSTMQGAGGGDYPSDGGESCLGKDSSSEFNK